MSPPDEYNQVKGLRAELIELRAGAGGLARQVESLSGALMLLSDLQRVQAEQRVELAEVKSTVVPRREHEQEESRKARELRDYRRVILRRMWAGGVILLALILCMGVLGTSYVQHAREETFNLCQTENASRASQRAYLAAVRDSSTNPILQQQATRTLANYADADCERLR